MASADDQDVLMQALQRLRAAERHLRTDDAARRACMRLLERCSRQQHADTLHPSVRAVALEVARSVVEEHHGPADAMGSSEPNN